VVQHEDGLFLHQFKWLESEDLIGEIPHTWNFLVGEEEKLDNGRLPDLIHYTLGGPYFEDYKGSDYEEIWEHYKTETTSAG